MSLVSLPAEILQQICRYVRGMDYLFSAIEEFRSLVLSCRPLYKIALPFLYHSLDFGPPGMLLLFRSIIEKPELAAEIKNVVIHGDRSGRWELDLGEAYTLLLKSGLLLEFCVQHLHPNDRKAITALLVETFILQLSQVEDLSISVHNFPTDFVFFDEERWKPGSQDSPSQLLPALRKLSVYTHPARPKSLKSLLEGLDLQKGVQISEDNEEGFQEDERESQQDEWESTDDESDFEEHEREPRGRVDILSHVQRLLALSKPQELYIETDFVLPYTCFWLRLPSVVKVSISCDSMNSEDFNLFLISCPNICSLSFYGQNGPPLTADFDSTINVRRIIMALEHRQHELESLEIVFHQKEEGYIMARDTIPDMRHFSRLTILELDYSALFDLPQDAIFLSVQDAKVGFIDKVPRTLKHLRIFQTYEKHMDEMKALAHRKAQDLPEFENLTLEWWCGDSEDPLDELERELSKAGIELVLT